MMNDLQLERKLDLTIRLNRTDVEIEVYEPESGETSTVKAPFSPDEHPEFDAAVGEELYSWICLWKDAADEAAEALGVKTSGDD